MRNEYTAKQVKFITQNFDKYNNVDLAKRFNEKFGQSRTAAAISCKLNKLGLKRTEKIFKKFNYEQREFIKKNIANTEKDLTMLVNKKFGTNYTVNAITGFKARMKLKSGLVGGRFEKGQYPFNKGKKWDEFMPKESQERSRTTTFKKGNLPNNHRDVGSERITKDGYIEIKVAEPNKWRLKHYVVWEKVHGKVPKGFKLIFLDQNRQNLDISNLAMIKDGEELEMNRLGIFSKDKTRTQIGVSIAKIYYKTRKLKKEKNEKQSNLCVG